MSAGQRFSYLKYSFPFIIMASSVQCRSLQFVKTYVTECHSRGVTISPLPSESLSSSRLSCLLFFVFLSQSIQVNSVVVAMRPWLLYSSFFQIPHSPSSSHSLLYDHWICENVNKESKVLDRFKLYPPYPPCTKKSLMEHAVRLNFSSPCYVVLPSLPLWPNCDKIQVKNEN